MRKMKNIEDKSRLYRIIIHNLNADSRTVEDLAREELGNINIFEWQIERTYSYNAPVSVGPKIMMAPQRDIVVKLKYREIK